MFTFKPLVESDNQTSLLSVLLHFNSGVKSGVSLWYWSLPARPHHNVLFSGTNGSDAQPQFCYFYSKSNLPPFILEISKPGYIKAVALGDNKILFTITLALFLMITVLKSCLRCSSRLGSHCSAALMAPKTAEAEVGHERNGMCVWGQSPLLGMVGTTAPLICSAVTVHAPITPFTFFKVIFMAFMFPPWPLALGTLEKETRALVSALQVLLVVLDWKARSTNPSFGILCTRWIQLCSHLYKIPQAWMCDYTLLPSLNSGIKRATKSLKWDIWEFGLKQFCEKVSPA